MSLFFVKKKHMDRAASEPDSGKNGRKASGRRMLGNILLVFTAMIWGTAFAFQRSGMDSVGPLTFTASRMTLAAAAVGLVPLLKKKPADLRDDAERKTRERNTVAGGIICGVFLALASIFQQAGIVTTAAGKAGFLTAMYILLVPVINFVLFRKRNTWLVWTAVLVGVAGMYLLCRTEDVLPGRGDTLVCICAVLFSGHILCCDRYAGRGDPVRIAAIQFLTAALISWAAAFLLESPDPDGVRNAMGSILYCGLVSGGAGYTLQMIAQKYTEPTTASLLMSLEAVFAAVAGALLLKERMSPRELLGCAVMLAAIVLVQIPVPDKRTRRKE